ncbi:MAG: LppC family lipoprotein [Gammaproteobacteria bacterium]|jgi:outer membrane PBP1 activator LpoA protein|nr:LppC family lipoprotein [Gammaproteobacteria bacterium]
MRKIVSHFKLFFLSSTILILAGCGAGHKAPVVDLAQTPPVSAPSNLPQKLVILLPQQGDFSAAGKTVQDGFNAAYQQASGAANIKVTILDSENYPTPAQAYQAAQDAQPGLIVGPLTKPAVNALSLQAGLPVKTLALNQADPNAVAPLNLFQFSLSPQADAQQVAQKMLQENLQKVIVVAPTGDWGQGISESFGQTYLAGQGQIVDSVSYDPNGDVAADVQKMMQVHGSDDFKGAAIFLVSTAKNSAAAVAAVKPLNLPIYTLPIIYSGSNETVLEGLHFAASPLMLDPQNPVRVAFMKANPNATQQDLNLYGFGMDAFLLAQYALKTGGFESLALQGNSGYLTMDTTGVVRRELTWATVVGGKLVPDNVKHN